MPTPRPPRSRRSPRSLARLQNWGIEAFRLFYPFQGIERACVIFGSKNAALLSRVISTPRLRPRDPGARSRARLRRACGDRDRRSPGALFSRLKSPFPAIFHAFRQIRIHVISRRRAILRLNHLLSIDGDFRHCFRPAETCSLDPLGKCLTGSITGSNWPSRVWN